MMRVYLTCRPPTVWVSERIALRATAPNGLRVIWQAAKSALETGTQSLPAHLVTSRCPLAGSLSRSITAWKPRSAAARACPATPARLAAVCQDRAAEISARTEQHHQQAGECGHQEAISSDRRESRGSSPAFEKAKRTFHRTTWGTADAPEWLAGHDLAPGPPAVNNSTILKRESLKTNLRILSCGVPGY